MSSLPVFRRVKIPSWIAWGDEGAFAIFVALIVGGFFTSGYAGQGLTRGWAFFGCGALGLWGLIGFVSGRFIYALNGPAKWIMGLLAAWCIWGGIQCLPLPPMMVDSLSPAVGEARKAMMDAGIKPPSWATFALAPEKAVLALHELIASMMFFFGICFLVSRASMTQRIAVTIAIASVIEGWIGLVNFGFRDGSRAYGAAVNPNHHTALALIGLPMAVILSLGFGEKRRGMGNGAIEGSDPSIVLLGLVIISTIGAILSFSRGGVALHGAVILGWLGLEGFGGRAEPGPRREASPMGFREVALVAGSFALLVFFAAATEGLLARFSTPEPLGSGRIQLAQATLGGLAETHFWGLGMRGAEASINQRLTMPTITNAIYAHNDFAQAAAELGWPGIVATLLFAYGFGRELRRYRKAVQEKFSWAERRLQRAAWAGVIATLLHALVDFHLRIPLIGFLFLALLAMTVQNGPLHLMHRGRPERVG